MRPTEEAKAGMVEGECLGTGGDSAEWGSQEERLVAKVTLKQ